MKPEPTVNILLVEDNPGDAELVRELLSDVRGTRFATEWSSTLVEALDRLAEARYDAVLLDLTLPDSRGLETFRTLRTHAPSIPVLLLTGMENESISLTAVQEGAQDYIVKGRFSGDSLARSIRYAIVRQTANTESTQSPQGPKLARFLACIGAKGGVGTSSVACHLALELRQRLAEDTLLVDLEMQSGNLEFMTKSSSHYSILDAAKNLQRLDSSCLDSFVSRFRPGLDVIHSPRLEGVEDPPPPVRVRHVIRLARSQYSWIVADAGRLQPFSLALIRDANAVLLVTTPDVLGLFEAKRIIARLTEQDFNMHAISLIINQAGKSDMGDQEIQEIVGRPVLARLPRVPHELQAVYGNGRLLEDSSEFRRSLSRAVPLLSGVEPAEPESKPGLASGFMRLLRSQRA